MMKFFFTKMSGSGNDFILFDKKINPKLELTPSKIAQICNRRTGIGADGVILLEPGVNSVFVMKYFNADGYEGSLCGNGARCSLFYSKEIGWSNSSNINFKFGEKNYSGTVLDGELVKFNFQMPEDLKIGFVIQVDSQSIKASYINTGSPHVVICVEDVLRNIEDSKSFYTCLDDFPVLELGKKIRYHEEFAPTGVNVNFIKYEDGLLKIRTYERGVEDETLSCGTGAVASAVVACKMGLAKQPITLLAKSGDQLIVDFKFDGLEFTDVSLTGPVKVVFNGEITI